MRLSLLVLFMFVLTLPTAIGAADERVLFDFSDPQAARSWQAVNDGVMGGRSEGRFRITGDNYLEFFGNLSLENNGGFASIRATSARLGLSADDAIVARVRGDGREYNLNLYPQSNLGGYSFRQPFKTTAGKWIDVKLPLDGFKATWRGQSLPNERLEPGKLRGIGILLGDNRPGPFRLELDWIKAISEPEAAASTDIDCAGSYPHHLQGVSTDGEAIYWCFTTTLVKTDMQGVPIHKVDVANHHGDLCLQDGKLYVAVNLGKFNDPHGNADSWVYVYDADSLREIARHETQEVFYGAGGIGTRAGHWFVVGGLPAGVEENYVYEYDQEFKFLTRHTLASGHTQMGIQTATFAHDRWWFGCYGDPRILLVTDSGFQMKGRYEQDCSLGIAGLSDGRLLVADGRCVAGEGCTGLVRTAVPGGTSGFSYGLGADDGE